MSIPFQVKAELVDPPNAVDPNRTRSRFDAALSFCRGSDKHTTTVRERSGPCSVLALRRIQREEAAHSESRCASRLER